MKMDAIIAEPTSAEDLFRIAGKRCNIYQYSDLKNFNDIDELFEDYDGDSEVVEEVIEEVIEKGYDSDSSSDWDEKEEITHEVTTTEEIEELPFDNNAAIILYKSEPQYGHWTMVSRNGKVYNYLDSYGDKIDNPLSYVPKSVNKELGQDKKYLARLLLKAVENGGAVYYNNAKLQKLDPNVATCGRYCAAYLKFSDMNVDDFAKMIKKFSKEMHMTNDELVSYLSMVDLGSE